MEAENKLFIRLEDEDIIEIEPLLERLNGLEELSIILTESESDIRDKIHNEIKYLRPLKENWVEKICNRQKYNLDLNYMLDLMEKVLIIDVI